MSLILTYFYQARISTSIHISPSLKSTNKKCISVYTQRLHLLNSFLSSNIIYLEITNTYHQVFFSPGISPIAAVVPYIMWCIKALIYYVISLSEILLFHFIMKLNLCTGSVMSFSYPSNKNIFS